MSGVSRGLVQFNLCAEGLLRNESHLIGSVILIIRCTVVMIIKQGRGGRKMSWTRKRGVEVGIIGGSSCTTQFG